MKKIETQAKELKAQLKAAMEKAGTKTWETPNGIKITLVEDKEVIKKGRSGYVKITLPKEK